MTENAENVDKRRNVLKSKQKEIENRITMLQEHVKQLEMDIQVATQELDKTKDNLRCSVKLIARPRIRPGDSGSYRCVRVIGHKGSHKFFGPVDEYTITGIYNPYDSIEQEASEKSND